jgi:hypothetical protein
MNCVKKAVEDRGFPRIIHTECRFTATRTELELKDSASGLIYFIEQFDSSVESVKKLKKDEKVSVFPSLP